MVVSIDPNHEIFHSRDYEKDMVPFSLIELVRQAPFLLESDEKSFVLGTTAPTDVPVWVWTSDSISEQSKKELSGYFWERFQNRNPLCFVAKPDIAALLARPFLEKLGAEYRCVPMEGFENPKVIPAKNTQVQIEHPSPADAQELAVCMAEFHRDCYGGSPSPESFLEEARELVKDPWLFVIKQQGSVAATAKGGRETGRHMAVNLVYTKPAYRGRGFAAALTAHLSSLILKKGKTPVLYTDVTNPASNQAYQNIGFVKRGRVDEVTLSWD